MNRQKQTKESGENEKRASHRESALMKETDERKRFLHLQGIKP